MNSNYGFCFFIVQNLDKLRLHFTTPIAFFNSVSNSLIASRLYCGSTIGMSFDILKAVAKFGFTMSDSFVKGAGNEPTGNSHREA